MSEKPYANALEEIRVRDLRETFDAAHYALNNPMASIPSDEWGGRKDMMCPDDEDDGLDFNRSGWSAEVIASGPLGVRPEDSIVLTASAAAAIQQVLMELLQAALAARQPVGQEPVPMVLYCPSCHTQHVDAPDERTPGWQNPPHRSHLCHGCGLIWRPADVPTIGVERTQTAGKNDSPFTPPAQPGDLGHARVIELLLTVAEAAYTLADNANDMEACEHVEHADFVTLSDALDALDELPDDQPGYTMCEPAKARWALRDLIDGQAVGNG